MCSVDRPLGIAWAGRSLTLYSLMRIDKGQFVHKACYCNLGAILREGEVINTKRNNNGNLIIANRLIYSNNRDYREIFYNCSCFCVLQFTGALLNWLVNLQIKIATHGRLVPQNAARGPVIMVEESG